MKNTSKLTALTLAAVLFATPSWADLFDSATGTVTADVIEAMSLTGDDVADIGLIEVTQTASGTLDFLLNATSGQSVGFEITANTCNAGTLAANTPGNTTATGAEQAIEVSWNYTAPKTAADVTCTLTLEATYL